MSYDAISNMLHYLRLGRQSRSELTSLFESARGRDVYILGSGPSLNDIDLSIMDGAVVLYLNNAVKVNKYHAPHKKISIITDFLRMEELRDYIVSLDDVTLITSTDKVFNNSVDWRLYSKPAKFVMPKVNLNRFSIDFCQSFSTDLNRGAYIGRSVLFLALQVAYQMSPIRVSLVGVDMTSNTGAYYDDSVKGNWSEFSYLKDGKSHIISSRQAFKSQGILFLNLSSKSLIKDLPLGR